VKVRTTAGTAAFMSYPRSLVSLGHYSQGLFGELHGFRYSLLASVSDFHNIGSDIKWKIERPLRCYLPLDHK